MFQIRFDSGETKRALQAAKADLQNEVGTLMRILGISVLSEAQQAYVTKSNGGVGSDGIQWDKLKRSTLAGRVGKRGRGRSIIRRRSRLANQIRTLDRSRPVRPPAGSSPQKRRAYSERIKRTNDKIKNLRDQRKKLRQEFERLVDAAVSRHQIGVDTGLQRASVQPGFVGGDGQGGNKFDVQGNSVTVGYGRSYSEHFDRKRTLIPGTLPKAWEQELERLTENWASDVLSRYFPS